MMIKMTIFYVLTIITTNLISIFFIYIFASKTLSSCTGKYSNIIKILSLLIHHFVCQMHNIIHSTLYFQAKRKTDGALTAAKIVDIKSEQDLDDFMVEIDILAEFKHKYVVNLFETYYFEDKLWVIFFFLFGTASIMFYNLIWF